MALNTKENRIIESILVTIGQAVEKDQVLYTLDLKELDKQIKRKKSGIGIKQSAVGKRTKYPTVCD